jgi:predicted DNA-binding protein (UPF0251 family)
MKRYAIGDGTALGLTLGEAAKQTGKSKATLSRAVKNGRISALKQDDGSFSIEPSELFRVYKRVYDETLATIRNTANETVSNPTSTPEKDIELATLRAELSAARDKIDDLKRQADEIREDRDAWKHQANRLLSAPVREQKFSIWRRLFGT